MELLILHFKADKWYLKYAGLINIDLSGTRLVGITHMDYIIDFLKMQKDTGGNVIIRGLGSRIVIVTQSCVKVIF